MAAPAWAQPPVTQPAIDQKGLEHLGLGQPTLDQLARQFEAVALGHEHGPALGFVQKWTDDVKIALFAAPGWDMGPYLRQIVQHMREIESLTGVRIKAATSLDTATLRFGFYPTTDFAKMPGDPDDPYYREWVETSACIALAIGAGDRSGRIMAGAIAIGTDISESQRRHCILEELVQVMGLPNDACHYRPSLFCEDDRVFAMTAADRLLLRALYDSRLPAGTPKAEAIPIARKLLAEMLPDLAAPPQHHIAGMR